MTLPATGAPAPGASTPEANNGEQPRRTWADGPRISDLERRQYEFEGGGAASERRAGKRRSWLRKLMTRS